MRRSERISRKGPALGLALSLLLGALLPGSGAQAAGGPDSAPPPARVVSINLCTDQLAMMLAAPGQLVSVSYIARDPIASAMAKEAQGWPVNHGQAEEIFALRPDLVLAGAYSDPATVLLLRRLGIRVETFAPATGLADVPKEIAAVGHALGRDAEAEKMVAAFQDRLARLRRAPGSGPSAASYAANGYSLGNETLAGETMAAAGLHNLAPEAGLTRGGTLPLETLLMLAPEVLVTGTRYARPSRSEEILDHPALRALVARGTEKARLADRDWICGTPHVLDALDRLEQAADRRRAAK